MDHYFIQLLNDTTEYIETHLTEELTLDMISEYVHVSKFHLLRIWKGASASGLMAYVRNRRIAASLKDLLTLNTSIDFIADQYGFSCERTYNRVFKEAYGITPAKWRRNPTPLKIQEPFNVDFMITAGEGLIYPKSILVLPGFTLAGKQYSLTLEAGQRSADTRRLAEVFFYDHRKRILNPAEKDIYYGYTSFPNQSQSSHIHYLTSLHTDQNSIIPPDMSTQKVLPHQYGVFTYMGLHRPEEITPEKLESLWTFIYDKWMPTVTFNLKEPFYFERIDYSKCSKQYCECDLYYPMTGLS